MKVLVVYASVHGSTAEVAAFIGRNLRVYDLDVTVSHADNVRSVDSFDVIVMGSAVHASMWLPSLTQFMARFESDLQQKQLYMWLSCIVVLEENGIHKAYETYLWDEALKRINLSRENITMLAGKLDWDKLSGEERWLLGTNYEGKELPGSQRGDFRDWAAISNWAHYIAWEINPRVEFPEVEANAEMAIKEETNPDDVNENLAWPDNPGEGGV